jgi:hypothetical protein
MDDHLMPQAWPLRCEAFLHAQRPTVRANHRDSGFATLGKGKIKTGVPAW